MSKISVLRSAQRTIKMEIDALLCLTGRLDKEFEAACRIILNCKGRVVVTGMGKSGHIGRKIAATLASTGTPAFYVHPGEASHGDLGMILPTDVVLAISNSGSTGELLTILPMIKRMNTQLVTMTGNPDSTLAKEANANIDVSVSLEACPLDLTPTSSTTTTLVMGDALAIALLEERGFTAEDFAFSHPNGALGKKLLIKVKDIMHTGSTIPRIDENATLSDALLEMSSKGLGMTTIVDAKGKLLGVYTDGDLRRTLDQKFDLHKTLITELMTATGKTIGSNSLAAEALHIMEESKITALVVLGANNTLKGVIHMHDILRAGVA